MDTNIYFWLGFAFIFLLVFIIDMFITGRRKDKIEIKAALLWSAVWVSTALIFGTVIYFYFPFGSERAFEFIASYLVEYSLSVDNLFVFIMIFGVMGIKEKNQPRILKWGIIGAVILRILFILAGVELIQKFQFTTYIFGAVLVYTAYKMLLSKHEQINPERNLIVKLASRLFKVKTDEEGDHFFVKHNKTTYTTVALITLILIESTDVIFAVDSIPAVLAITHDPFIAITSNLFAILGLRSLFFALAGILNIFRYLKFGISFILFFVGVKMLISHYVHIPVGVSLAVIIMCIAISILASILYKVPEEKISKL